MEFDPKTDGFVNHCGIIIDKKEKGEAEGHCVIKKHHMNPWNMAHGGLAFTMMDTVAGNAVRSLSNGERNTVTMSANTYFIKPIREGLAVCRGKVIKDGNRVAVAEACIYDEKETLLAKASFEFFYV